jgi:hypothetical protein
LERIGFKIILKWTKRILPVVVGAVGGYLYYHYVGCNRGCAITGNPIISTAYGAFAGFLFVDWKSIFNKNKKEEVKDID